MVEFNINFYVDYSWPMHLNSISCSGFGANRRLHSSISGRGRLDICILWTRLIKRLCSVGELFSRLRWKAYKVMIHNHWVIPERSFMYSIDYFITTLWIKHPYQRTARKLKANKRIYRVLFGLLRVVNFDIFESAHRFWWVFFTYIFKWDLKFSISVTIPKIFSSVTFSIEVSLKEKSGNGS